MSYLRLVITGTRHEAEQAALSHGIRHIGFEPPLGHEGRPGEVLVGVVDATHSEDVERWFNDDPPAVDAKGFPPGTLLSFSNQPRLRPVPFMTDLDDPA